MLGSPAMVVTVAPQAHCAVLFIPCPLRALFVQHSQPRLATLVRVEAVVHLNSRIHLSLNVPGNVLSYVGKVILSMLAHVATVDLCRAPCRSLYACHTSAEPKELCLR